ncbi:MAG TPA: serine hydrolase [Thermoanaerobaculia bacterium]|nr:serine hydrolase [Thermoanaerobaculia bacterium]
MRSIILILLTLPLLACASGGPKPVPSVLALRLERFLHPPGGTVAVFYHNLGTGATYARNEGETFHAASTMKIPLMMALFQAVDNGELRLDQPIPVRNQFQSLVDGSSFALDPKEDGDPDLYQAVGSTRPLEELIRRMITRSSNLATNLLIEKIGASRAQDLVRGLGAYRTILLRGVEDEKAYRAGLNNVTAAEDLAVALNAIAQGTGFKPASSQKMIEFLKAQEFNEKIPAGLPPGTPVAHKTGDITGFHHDAAIVYPPGEKPYILVVMTQGYEDEKDANRVIAGISQVVWERRADPLAGPEKEPTKPPREGG